MKNLFKNATLVKKGQVELEACLLDKNKWDYVYSKKDHLVKINNYTLIAEQYKVSIIKGYKRGKPVKEDVLKHRFFITKAKKNEDYKVEVKLGYWLVIGLLDEIHVLKEV